MARYEPLDLVEADFPAPLTVTYVGVDISVFPEIEMHLKYEDTTRLNYSLTGGEITVIDGPNGVFQVDFGSGDLIPGTHEAEFEFTDTGGGTDTFPKRSPLLLKVRRQIA